MKTLLLLSALLLMISGCSKEGDDTNTLAVHVKLKYDGEKHQFPKPAVVYLFEDVSIHDGYGYAGSGVLEQEVTGHKINYSKKASLQLGYVFFEGLQNKTHTVFVDASALFNDNIDDKSLGMSINLGNALNKDGGELEMVFDITPYVAGSDIWK